MFFIHLNPTFHFRPTGLPLHAGLVTPPAAAGKTGLNLGGGDFSEEKVSVFGYLFHPKPAPCDVRFVSNRTSCPGPFYWNKEPHRAIKF